MSDIIRSIKHMIKGTSRRPGTMYSTLGAAPVPSVPSRKLKAVTVQGGRTGARSRLSTTVKGIRKK